MPKNMGLIDRLVRLAIAAIVAVLILTGQIGGAVAIVVGILAAVFLLTSIVSFCPIWHALKISTMKKQG